MKLASRLNIDFKSEGDLMWIVLLYLMVIIEDKEVNNIKDIEKLIENK